MTTRPLTTPGDFAHKSAHYPDRLIDRPRPHVAAVPAGVAAAGDVGRAP
ncbi:hypothetical protein [Tepidimonas charontis]|nr:hypothetical protein [Tepidimonas charontis]